jgi:hypothetical protein
MNFIASRSYLREENHCADKMANLGYNVQTLTWWEEFPLEVMSDFTCGKSRIQFSFALFQFLVYHIAI